MVLELIVKLLMMKMMVRSSKIEHKKNEKYWPTYIRRRLLKAGLIIFNKEKKNNK